MIPYYSFQRSKSTSRPSNSISIPSSPTYSPALVESPITAHTPTFRTSTSKLTSPSTPPHVPPGPLPSTAGATATATATPMPHPYSSLDPVDETRESGGSRAPLLRRDFAPGSSKTDPPGRRYPSTASTGGATSTSRLSVPENAIDEGSDTSNSSLFLPLVSDETLSLRTQTLPSIGESKPFDPSLLPPESAHDAYLAGFVTPLEPLRPNVARHSSAPGITQPHTAAPSPLLPSPLDKDRAAHGGRGVHGHGYGYAQPNGFGTGAGNGPGGGNRHGFANPLFEIFDADLSSGAEELAKRLKGHLEDVLRVQEEIGRMHLNLEDLEVGFEGLDDLDDVDGDGGDGYRARDAPESRRTSMSMGKGMPASKDWATPGNMGTGGTPGGSGTSTGKKDGAGAGAGREALSRREKGVDEIMERLGKLSDGLRTYHAHGTPRLIFPNPADASSRLRQRTQSVNVADLSSHTSHKSPSPFTPHPLSAQSNLSHPPITASPRPLVSPPASASGPAFPKTAVAPTSGDVEAVSTTRPFTKRAAKALATSNPSPSPAELSVPRERDGDGDRRAGLGTSTEDREDRVDQQPGGITEDRVDRQPGGITEDMDRERHDSRGSNLSPLSLSRDNSTAGRESGNGLGIGTGVGLGIPPGPGQREGEGQSHGDAQGQGRGEGSKERDRGDEAWKEQVRQTSLDSAASAAPAAASASSPATTATATANTNAKAAAAITQSEPIEMADRSRPW